MNGQKFSGATISSVVRVLGAAQARKQPPQPGEIDVPILYDPTLPEKIALFFKGGGKVVRFDTGRPWGWHGTFDNFDNSLSGGPGQGGRAAVLLRVGVTLDGQLPTAKPGAQRFIDALDLTEDETQIEKLLKTRVGEVWRQLCEARGGRVAEVLARDDWRHGLEDELCAALNKDGFGLRAARINGFGHQEDTLDFASGETPLKVRCKDSLAEREFHFNTRLVWGVSLRDVAARSLYLGGNYDRTNAGGDQRPGMLEPLVSGQIEPVERWFRKLLDEAMRALSWPELQHELRNGCATIIADLSEKLGTGTGRRIETLSIKHIRSADFVPTSKTFKFTHQYPIVGLTERKMTIDHDIKYSLADPDVWESAKSPQAEEKLKEIVIAATRNVLHGWTFGSIIESYRKHSEGDFKLSREIREAVGDEPAAFGFELEALSSIGVMRDRAFVLGRKFELPKMPYDFADPGMRLDIEVHASLQVGNKSEDYERFARSIQTDAAIDDRVRTRLERSIREQLRMARTYEYFTSSFVSAVPRRKRDQHADGTDDFRDRVKAAVDRELAEEFGLRVDILDLISPNDDEYVQRMRDLNSRDIVFENYSLQFGNAPFSLKIDTRIKVQGISPGHWDKFAPEVKRLTYEGHRDMIETRIADGMQTFEEFLTRGEVRDLGVEEVKTHVVRQVIDAIENECGLEANFSKFVVRIEPKGLDITRMELESNERNIELLLKERGLSVSAELYGDKDDMLTERINKLKKERDTLTHSLADMRAVTFSFFQNPGTGEIEGRRSGAALEGPASHDAPASADPESNGLDKGHDAYDQPPDEERPSGV